MVPVVRYRPAPVIKWLELGSATLRKTRNATRARKDVRSSILDIVGRIVREGKGAVANVAGRQIERIEYRLLDDRFEVTGALERTIPYGRITSIRETRPANFVVETTDGSLRIRPYAWLVVAGHKVPVGWLRDGMDVPFDILAEELAVRAKVAITRS